MLLEELMMDLIDDKEVDYTFPSYFWINPYKKFPDDIIKADEEHVWYILAKPQLFGIDKEEVKRILDKYKIPYNKKTIQEMPEELENPLVWSELIKLANKNHWVRCSKQSNTIYNLQSINIKDIQKVVNVINKAAYIERIYIDTEVTAPSDGSTVSYNNRLVGKRLEKFMKTGYIPTSLVNEATSGFVKTENDPALMTFYEYYQIINKDDKSHPSCAYDWKLEDMNNVTGQTTKEDYPILINTIVRNGIKFEIRMNKFDKIKENRYAKRNPTTGETIKDGNGNVVFYDEDELLSGVLPNLLKNRYDYEFGVFDGDDIVAVIQDEWGCVLIVVAEEYRHFGLGQLLYDKIIEYFPTKPSGGFTQSGYQTMKNAYTRLVKKYLSSGFYSHLIKTGQITQKKVNKILKSIDLKTETNIQKNVDLSIDAKDNLLFFDGMGTFILYNKKYKDIHNNEKYRHFADKMILGMIYVTVDEQYSRIKIFGGNDNSKSLLLQLVGSWIKQFNVPLVVEPSDEKYMKNFNILEKSKKAGYDSIIAEYVGEPIDLELLSKPEKMFRKSFDVYDEFKDTLIEDSYKKYR